MRRSYIDLPEWLWAHAPLILLLVGLGLTLIGGGIAASGVILSEDNARALASMKWDFNQELYESLLSQSRRAMSGLIVVAIGTAIQFIGIVVIAVASQQKKKD
ncbi:MAG TPA: hypothetical protein VGZ89_04305 [Xanthobacteraceae bacterium]|jgi:hypothetical protein|nr:hypothetical protein [Xanthobacteraceae bacterium]